MQIRWPVRCLGLSAVAMLAVTMLALTAAGQGPGEGDPMSGTSEAFLEVLARVPAGPEALVLPVSYIDYRAVELARTGAARPATLDGLLTQLGAGDPAADAWLAAAMGIASGPTELMVDLFSLGSSFPESVGFDFFDIDRALEFGSPPSSGLVLLGRFDPGAIATAHEARAYTGTAVGARVLWCGDPACEAGHDVDLAGRDPRVPFGGRLGRREPVAVSGEDLLNSADIGTLNAMLAAADGEAPTLATEPAHRALALAPADGVILIQATLLPADIMQAEPDLAGMLGSTPDEAAAIMAELRDTAPALPIAQAIGILDGASADEQVLTIALAFSDEADAEVAADAVVQRLATVRSLTREVSVSQLLDDRGVTSVAGRAMPATAETQPVAVIELRAPLARDERDPDGGSLPPSSELYRLFLGMVFSRDVLWLAPSAPSAPAG